MTYLKRRKTKASKAFNVSSVEFESPRFKPLVKYVGKGIRGSKKYRVSYQTKPIGLITGSQNFYNAALSFYFGDAADDFVSLELATDWLIQQYLKWQNQAIEVLPQQTFWFIRHGGKYIGQLYYSQEYSNWIAIADPLFGKSTMSRCQTFSEAKDLIISAHLN